jgi:hypothetical protein
VTQRPSRPPPRFFLHLTGCSYDGFFAWLNYSSRKFPATAIRDEAIPPHHENAIIVVQDGSNCYSREPDDVMLETASPRWLYINQGELNPSIAVDQAFAMN